jgi:hypothetical protein
VQDIFPGIPSTMLENDNARMYIEACGDHNSF